MEDKYHISTNMMDIHINPRLWRSNILKILVRQNPNQLSNYTYSQTLIIYARRVS